MQQPFLGFLRLGAHDMSLCQSWPLPVDPNKLKVQAQEFAQGCFFNWARQAGYFAGLFGQLCLEKNAALLE